MVVEVFVFKLCYEIVIKIYFLYKINIILKYKCNINIDIEFIVR